MLTTLDTAKNRGAILFATDVNSTTLATRVGMAIAKPSYGQGIHPVIANIAAFKFYGTGAAATAILGRIYAVREFTASNSTIINYDYTMLCSFTGTLGSITGVSASLTTGTLIPTSYRFADAITLDVTSDGVQVRGAEPLLLVDMMGAQFMVVQIAAASGVINGIVSQF